MEEKYEKIYLYLLCKLFYIFIIAWYLVRWNIRFEYQAKSVKYVSFLSLNLSKLQKNTEEKHEKLSPQKRHDND